MIKNHTQLLDNKNVSKLSIFIGHWKHQKI